MVGTRGVARGRRDLSIAAWIFAYVFELGTHAFSGFADAAGLVRLTKTAGLAQRRLEDRVNGGVQRDKLAT